MKLSKEDQEFLELYSDSQYDKPSVTVDTVIFRLASEQSQNYRKLAKQRLEVLLLKREFSPFKGAFSVPGTFIDLKNELSLTMQACVKKKVGLENYYFEQLYTFGDRARDPRTRVLSVSYMLLTSSASQTNSGEWFGVSLKQVGSTASSFDGGYSTTLTYELTLTGSQVLKSIIEVAVVKNGLSETKTITVKESPLAFDHAKIIFYALERLKNKLEYTDIAFNLLGSKFTLTELKNSYEVILGERLLDANFRRKIKGMVTPLAEYSANQGHRPSQLFVHKASVSINNID